jgi:hypothetical protein
MRCETARALGGGVAGGLLREWGEMILVISIVVYLHFVAVIRRGEES